MPIIWWALNLSGVRSAATNLPGPSRLRGSHTPPHTVAGLGITSCYFACPVSGGDPLRLIWHLAPKPSTELGREPSPDKFAIALPAPS